MSSYSSTLLKSYILAKKIVNSLTSGKEKKKETKYSAIGAMRNIGYKHNNCL